MDDEGLTPKKLERIVNSAINPTVAYRKEICRRLARQIYNQFGMEGLYDLLSAVDDIGKISSIVISDRTDVENYLFQKFGIFDQDMFERIQLSEDWDDLISELLELSSERIALIILKTIEGENG